MQFNPAHFPGRAGIDSYGNGGFRFADMSHQGSLLLLKDGIYAWSPRSVADFSPESFAPVLEGDSGLELLLIGTGTHTAEIGDSLERALRARGIRFEIMDTGAAARTFNVLLAEGREIGAALLAV